MYTGMLVQLQYATNIGVYLNFRKRVSYLTILKASQIYLVCFLYSVNEDGRMVYVHCAPCLHSGGFHNT